MRGVEVRGIAVLYTVFKEGVYGDISGTSFVEI